MTDIHDIDRAEARVTDARQRLNGTLGALQARLDPRTVARDAVDNIAEGGARALDAGVAAVKRNPAAIAGAVAVVAAVLARHRIGAWLAGARAKRRKARKPARAKRV